jgi:arylsulfatase A-like enzyme
MPERSQPNVLLVSTDHWPGSLMGAAGHPVIETPTLDDLCRNGTRFTRAYSECPVCIPARRTLMTGTTPRTHGDRCYKDRLPMPGLPTLAQTFRDAGYQAYGVGKMHVYPPRSRIGFDDVLLAEEGRLNFGCIDDHEVWLGDRGFAGRLKMHGMTNNDYHYAPWHLPDATHVTNWAAEQMCRTIQRRDGSRPSFWYLSFAHPHPPLVPLEKYMEMYRHCEIPVPPVGAWASDRESLPYALRIGQNRWDTLTPKQADIGRRAFYALCTHIDHQLRVVMGTLREEGLHNNTIILFTSDHGDMLGVHNLWAKRFFYEDSARVPMILVAPPDGNRVPHHGVDDRLVGWQDIMPTLLDLAGIDVPDTVEGVSMVGKGTRSHLYGERGEEDDATRMVCEDRYKLIYYPVGNRMQLFDLHKDPMELVDLSESGEHGNTRARLERILIGEMYGSDARWIADGRLVGEPGKDYEPPPNRGLSGWHGLHWPARVSD